MKYNDFESFKKIKWLAGDTETYTFIDNVKVSEPELIRLGKSKPQSWFREHCSVRAYAWLLSDGVHFAWLESLDEFVDFCCEHGVKTIWWYNAKFDFAIFDYALLSQGWKREEDTEDRDKTFSSLHNDMGARYSLKLRREYKGRTRKGDRHKRIHTFTNYDFCNLFSGGLARCLESFNVVDFENNPVRKLEMDYQGENDVTNTQALQYMKNDVIGLYHLVRIADSWLIEHCGYQLTGTKPDVITAGGLAKRQLLESLYNSTDKKENLKAFQREHKVDLAIDKCVRKHHLYRGGLTFVNPYKQGRSINQKIYKYDINSMYPAQMNTMPDLIGRPRSMSVEQFKKMRNKENYQIILEIDYMVGKLKQNMLGLWYDPNIKKFTESIHMTEDDGSIFIFLEEFNEYKNYWYDIEYNVKRVIVQKKRTIKGYSNFVQKFYKMKADGKAEKDKVKTAFAKLLLNSSYGKLSERCVRLKTHRELTEQDYVHMVADEYEEDETSIMSVIQGALVTSMARVSLLKYIREICGNVKQNLVYVDTDSVHSLVKYENTDDFELGKMKQEAIADYGRYLAPKTYIDGFLTSKGYEFEVHTKGVPTYIVKRFIDYKPIEQVEKIFNVGSRFMCLAGMNVSGGKALIPIPKMICKPDNCIMRNEDGEELLVDEIDQIIGD